MMGEEGKTIVVVDDGLIKPCFSAAMKAQREHERTTLSHFIVEKKPKSGHVIMGFAGSWRSLEADLLRSKGKFGECKVDLGIFPLLKNLCTDEPAKVNEAFLHRFSDLFLEDDRFQKKEKLILTGHSIGGSIAIIATLWLLNQSQKPGTNLTTPQCITFGSPLVGDQRLVQAICRENWSSHFINFVSRHDVVPQILFSPFSSIHAQLRLIPSLWTPFSSSSNNVRFQEIAAKLYTTVMTNTLSIASCTSASFSIVPGVTNPMFDAIASMVELSPHRPFGLSVFFDENMRSMRMVGLENCEATLQVMFYTAQSDTHEVVEVAKRGLALSTQGSNDNETNSLLHDFGLTQLLTKAYFTLVYLIIIPSCPLSDHRPKGKSPGEFSVRMCLAIEATQGTKARLALCMARQSAKQKQDNQAKVSKSFDKLQPALSWLMDYRDSYEKEGTCYYDPFKAQNNTKDFKANVTRLQLAGLWDEVIALLRDHQLPDIFETNPEWVGKATTYRRLVEPLDIANYYRHARNKDCGPYMDKGRPRRYKYPQKWLERSEPKIGSPKFDSSWLMAEVEEMLRERSFIDMKEKVLDFEMEMLGWKNEGMLVLRTDIGVAEGSTFLKWWNTLPVEHRENSCIKDWFVS
ncbi:protein EDS1B-like [Amborella trichopoda]|uniref:protein EDS1B-like n=1 Tax=Amborella trichopoda TaxID=13333 RepID=UPI0009BCA305|nr:protein EDS1B-like [Amborella trichopoda]|eukprot:XP_020517447.1 protein EDS1B-like [Amborella trichopoda]